MSSEFDCPFVDEDTWPISTAELLCFLPISSEFLSRIIRIFPFWLTSLFSTLIFNKKLSIFSSILAFKYLFVFRSLKYKVTLLNFKRK